MASEFAPGRAPLVRGTVFCAVLGAAAALLVHPASAAEPPTPPLVRVYYDMEVINYCMLGDASVRDGFRREAGRIERRLAATPEQVEQARMAAWTAAYREWQNRGLGGFRGWCRNEGRDAVERFSAAAPGS